MVAFLIHTEFFNTKLAQPRIKSEHCIGALKGRFQHLKHLRVVILKKNSVRKINHIIWTCAVMHNLMLDEPCPEEWIEAEALDENVDPGTDDRRRTIFANICDRFR